MKKPFPSAPGAAACERSATRGRPRPFVHRRLLPIQSLLLVLAAGPLASCAFVTYIPTAAVERAPRRPDEVRLFEQLPDRPARQIGILVAQGANEELVLAKLTRVAAERGCDAVAGFRRREEWWGSDGRVFIGQGVCLAYEDPATGESER